MIFAHETTAFRDLVFGRRPLHVKDLVAWTDRSFRMAMAVEAPAHGQRRRLPRQRHPIDCAMTGRAPDALRDVNAMIEIDVVREDMDPLPANRLVGG